MDNHTPGPWKLENGNVRHEKTSLLLAKMIDHLPINGVPQKANGLLIAAAPELLASCLALIAKFEEIEEAEGMDLLTVSLVHEAKIATLDAQGIVEEGYND